MFQRLLGSRITHADPQVRAKAFGQSDVDQKTLSEYLLIEKDADVLCVILARADDVAKVLEHAKASGPSSIADVARARLLSLAQQPGKADQPTWSALYQTAEAENWSQRDPFVDIISSSPGFEDLALGALDAHNKQGSFTLPQILLKSLVLNSHSSAVRQEAARQLTDREVVEACCHDIKDRDKMVYRALKARVDDYHLAEQQVASIKELTAQAQQLLELPVTAQNDAIAQINSKVQQVSAASQALHVVDALAADYQQLCTTVQNARDEMQLKLLSARRQVDQRNQILATSRQLSNPENVTAATLCDAPPTDLDSAVNDASKDEYSVDQLRLQWSAIPDHSDSEQQIFETALDSMLALEKEREQQQKNHQKAVQVLTQWEGQVDEHDPISLLKRVEKQWQALTLPQQHREQLSSRYEQLSSRIQSRQQNLENAREQNTKNLSLMVETLKESMANGDLKKAISLHDKLRAKLSKVDLDKNTRVKIEKELKAAHPKLDEYRKWRHFGTQQARENLIGQANQLLVDPPTSPKVLAEQIKGMREAWKKLDRDDGRAPEKQWLAFNSVCKDAYKPAKKHFNTLTKERKANAKEKLEIVDQFQTLFQDTDWETPDWPAVTEKLKELRLTWLKVGAVDFKVKKELQRDYSAINDQIDVLLEQERDSELQRRQRIIAQLKSHHENDELTIAVSAAKRMQRQWRPTVQSERKVEQALWEEFRGVCDAIFGNLKEESAAAKTAWQADVDERRALCEELQSLLGSEPQEQTPTVVQGRVTEIGQRWSSNSAIPNAVMAKLDKQYRTALSDFNKRLRQVKSQAAQRNSEAVDKLFDCARELEELVIKGDADEQKVASINSDWEKYNGATGPLAKLLTKRYLNAQRALEGDANCRKSILSDQPEALRKRQELCLLGELVADIASPEEFQSERRALQLSRLKEAMQGGSLEPRKELQNIIAQWYTLATIAREDWQALQSRFSLIRQAASAQ